jgi:predicted alpha/beta-hydrolase family hydrolase
MPGSMSQTLKLAIPGQGEVTVKVDAPAAASPAKKVLGTALSGDVSPTTPALILAHGANNNLDFPLLSYIAERLAAIGCARVIRFNFPYVERGATSPDPRPILEATFLQVYAYVLDEMPAAGTPVFVAGKSLGGRTAAELVSRRVEGNGIDAAGLVVLGYPLHAMGKQDRLFLEPLRHIDIPSLFCVGSRDPLCNPDLLRPVLARLAYPGRLHVVEDGDHSLHLPPSSDRRPEDGYPDVAREVADFIQTVAA